MLPLAALSSAISCHSLLYPGLSGSGNGGLLCDFDSMTDLRIVDFQFAQLFSLCEDGNDDFQVLSVLVWKLEVIPVEVT